MPADIATVREWLNLLGGLCAGNLAAKEAQAKVALYAPMLAAEFSEEAFTPDSLAAVAGACEFFPAYGKIVGELRGWWRAQAPSVPALPAPVIPAALTEAEEDALDRAWWGGRLSEIAAIADPTTRWRTAEETRLTLTRRGAYPRPWAVAEAESIAAGAKAAGADTNVVQLRTPRAVSEVPNLHMRRADPPRAKVTPQQDAPTRRPVAVEPDAQVLAFRARSPVVQRALAERSAGA
ncbi:hypothetical protein [Roseomonas elaeocarpi]|uniref:Uncharacterized protein n=1 Tax=Roseomonas elaeocarpi TaxID=907779 RepID=A0ABV6JZA8_9PROT